MDWKDIASKVGAAAPMLGTVLGGPAGAAIGGLIAAALGTHGDAGAVDAAIAANPEALLKLKQLEASHAERLQELIGQQAQAEMAAETARLQTEVEDRKSARDREHQTQDSLTPRVLALVVTVGFFGVLAWLLAYGKPAEGGDALLVMLGSLGTAWASIIAYYYGSSAGSRFKSELLAKEAATH